MNAKEAQASYLERASCDKVAINFIANGGQRWDRSPASLMESVSYRVSPGRHSTIQSPFTSTWSLPPDRTYQSSTSTAGPDLTNPAFAVVFCAHPTQERNCAALVLFHEGLELPRIAGDEETMLAQDSNAVWKRQDTPRLQIQTLA
jgi:hypothetical protein